MHGEAKRRAGGLTLGLALALLSLGACQNTFSSGASWFDHGHSYRSVNALAGVQRHEFDLGSRESESVSFRRYNWR